MAADKHPLGGKVDRSGKHHLWTGARTASGAGQIRIAGKLRTVTQIVWEHERGPIPDGHRVRSCPTSKLCVRIDHLALETYGGPSTPTSTRAERGSGSIKQLGEDKWKVTADAGRDESGRRRRVTRTVQGTKKQATRALATLSADVQAGRRMPVRLSSLTVDDLMSWYVDFARDVRGLERTTVFGYDEVYKLWLRDQIGHVNAERLKPSQIDNAFGRMRSAGLSHSRMNNARAALSGAYKWGRRHDMVSSNPMLGFELPKSKHVPRKTVAPEITELLTLLDQAATSDPELSPVLTLAATTGMRRGELAGLRRDRLMLDRGELRVERSISEIEGETEDKPTKTHDTRTIKLDHATVGFLMDHLAAMDDRAAELGTSIGSDGFVFSLEPNGALPMRPELMTRRMRQLRQRLGIGNGDFDATILAMRKWTSTELMDAGFNPSTVSGRQGHTVQVMLNDYSSRRASADQAAADHLGAVVHRGENSPARTES